MNDNFQKFGVHLLKGPKERSDEDGNCKWTKTLQQIAKQAPETDHGFFLLAFGRVLEDIDNT